MGAGFVFVFYYLGVREMWTMKGLTNIPEDMKFLASVATKHLRKDGIKYDYSPNSLHEIDQLFCEFHDEGCLPDEMGNSIFCAGAYVGEVIRRVHGGQWVLEEDGAYRLDVGNGVLCNPIAKVEKLLANGMQDSTHAFFVGLDAIVRARKGGRYEG